MSPPTSVGKIEFFEKKLTSSILHAWQDQGQLVRNTPSKAKKWWDKKVLDPLVKNRNHSRRLMLLDPSQENTNHYQYWNLLFRSKVNELKQAHWRRFLSQADLVSVYQALKFTCPCSGNRILPLQTNDGKITSDKKEQAKLLFLGKLRRRLRLVVVPAVDYALRARMQEEFEGEEAVRFLASKVIDRVETVSSNRGSDHQKLVISLTLAPPPPTFCIHLPPSDSLDRRKLLTRISNDVNQLSPPTSVGKIKFFKKKLTSSILHAWQDQGQLVCNTPSKAKKWWDKKVLDPLVKNWNHGRRLMLLDPSQENANQYQYWNLLFRSK
ncbi:hypothetical protein PSTG_17518, partial [Puccinia striiformis f. sp. tritici PST-78]